METDPGFMSSEERMEERSRLIASQELTNLARFISETILRANRNVHDEGESFVLSFVLRQTGSLISGHRGQGSTPFWEDSISFFEYVFLSRFQAHSSPVLFSGVKTLPLQS